MIKKVFLVLILVILFLTSFSASYAMSSNQLDQLKEEENKLLESINSNDEFLVKFKSEVSEDTKNKILSQYNSIEIGNGKLGIHKVASKNTLDQILNESKLNNNIEIEYIVQNFKRSAFLTPNDTYFNNQLNLNKLNMQNAWDITTGSQNIVVAVIDSGINLSHPDLQGKVQGGKNLLGNSNSTNIYDISGHGTFVSGIIGAATNNRLGIAGIGWNTKVMPLQVMFSDGSAYDSDIIEAIIYAVDNGARVINLSLGGPAYSSALQSAIDYAVNRNVVVVAAAGNDGNSTLLYPAACNGVIGVGSTNDSDVKSTFSQYNSSVDFVTPGENIVSTSTTASGYAIGGGTSFSAPQVSGLAALMLSVNPNLKLSQIENIMKSTSVDLGSAGRDNLYGYGRIDVFAAIKSTLLTLEAMGNIDNPTSGQTLSDSYIVSGWVLDASGVSKIEVLVDGSIVGTATYGDSRPDVKAAFPLYNNSNSGYHYSLDTTKLTNGTHTIAIRETSSNGTQTTFPARSITVSNSMVLGNIDNPTPGQTLSGTSIVNGWVLDASGVSKIEVLVDGSFVGTATYGDSRPDVKAAFPQYNNSNSGYHYSLDTTKLTNGTHSITIKVTSGNSSQTTFPARSITISNSSLVLGGIDNPSPGQTLSGFFVVNGWVLGDSGVSRIEVLVDGNVKGTATYGDSRPDVKAAYPQYNNSNAGYHYSLDTTSLTNGTHTITIRVTSSNGSQTTLPARTISISNSSLVLGSIDNPSPGQTLSGSFMINGWVLDASGVSKVEVLVDGDVKGTATYGDSRPDVKAAYPQYNNSNAGYHYSLDTTTLTNGAHTITVRETGGNGITSYLGTKNINILNNYWTLKAKLPSKRIYVKSGYWNGKIYAVDGWNRTIDEYDMARDTWVFKAYIPTLYWYSGSCLLDGKIYIIGGQDTNGYGGKVLEYDIASNSWRNRSDMPTGRDAFDVVGANGKLYAIGGRNGVPGYGSPTDVLEEYDIASNTWSTKAKLPFNAMSARAVVVGNKIYVFGGESLNNKYLSELKDVQIYDISTNTWTLGAEMPTGRDALGVAVLNGKVYAIGGHWAVPLKKVEVYDIIKNTWTSLEDMPTSRAHFGMVAVNGKIYVMGGGSYSSLTGSIDLDTLEQYTPPNSN